MKIRQNVDYTTRDYEGFRYDLLMKLKEKIPEYSDFSESDMGVVLIELLAHGLDIISYYNDKVANEIFPETATERESIIKHCRRLGYELKNSTPSRYYQVFKIIPQETTYVIPRGTKLHTKGDDLVEFELMEDIKIPPQCNGLEKDEHGNYLYKGIVEHGYTVNSDIIGTSNGTAYQDFTLSYAPVITDSLHIYIRDMNGVEEWERVNNFIDSDVTSKQYVMETTDNDFVKISFGSGISGAIPPVYDNGISASYRVGGGIIGNVSLETITEMSSKPSVIVDTMNVEQIQIASDKESIEQARIHAPLSLRTMWRAVSLEDYENLLIQEFPEEIYCARAVAEEDRFTISLYVLLKGIDTLPEANKTKYLEFLDERKEIGYNLQMYAPSFATVNLDIDITTNKAYKNNDVKTIVEGYVRDYFDLGNLQFGETFKLSHIIKNVMNFPGVLDLDVRPSGNTTPTKSEILKLGTLNIQVTGGI